MNSKDLTNPLILLKLYGDKWRAWGDSNARPLVPETSALSN
jgi:hypothetical protein